MPEPSAPMAPLLSVVIVNWNTQALLADCIDAVAHEATSLDYDIWVVDNGSTDDSVAMLRRDFPHVHLIESKVNLGFAGANNLAMQHSAGRYLLLLNTDAIVRPGAIRALLEVAETSPRAGIVGAHLLNPDGTFQASHTRFPTLWQEFLILSTLGRRLYGDWYPSHAAEEAKGPQRVDYVEGACLLVRRAALEQVGGLDEGYFMYTEEVDWCRRMAAHGWEVWYAPAARVVHIGGASSVNRKTSREADLYRSRVRYFRTYHGGLQASLLKGMIVCFTGVKQIGHGVLRRLTGNRRGRQVVTVGDLLVALRNV
ncbi:MAG TPA: glycosyltransferase family 2 protein [Chloroflexi bacterium]|nr:glycosyltransferase family 2 protein [Chloroflexota bacterium]